MVQNATKTVRQDDAGFWLFITDSPDFQHFFNPVFYNIPVNTLLQLGQRYAFRYCYLNISQANQGLVTDRPDRCLFTVYTNQTYVPLPQFQPQNGKLLCGGVAAMAGINGASGVLTQGTQTFEFKPLEDTLPVFELKANQALTFYLLFQVASFAADVIVNISAFIQPV